MIYPTAYRFLVFSALGQYKFLVTMQSSYLHEAGFRASITPEGICEEMTGLFRNGVHSDGSPGLGLRFGDIVQVQVTADADQASNWVQIFHGQLRLGGNRYDYEGENMVFNSLMIKLRATPTPDASYPQMDAGALARALTLATMTSGILGTTGTPSSLPINASAYDPTVFCPFSYNAAAMPDLGFMMDPVTATNRQPLGVWLDAIVARGKALGIELRCGIRYDSVLTLVPINTAEVLWPAEQIKWKSPQGLVLYTGVLWAISKKADGTWLRYTSKAPEAAAYGCEVKQLSIGLGVKPWKPLVIAQSIVGSVAATPAGGDSVTVTTDGRADTFLTVSNSSGAASISLTVPAGGAERLYVDAQETVGGGVAFVQVQYPNSGPLITVRGNDQVNAGFTAAPYYAGEGVLALGLPAGAVVTLFAGITTAGTATTLIIKEFHLDRLDTALLDGLAKYHYSVPLDAPGDLYRTGILPPSELGGKIRTPRPNGAPDYTANVSLWEYSVSAAGGVQTAAKIGDPDDPLNSARNALSRKGDILATANAQNVL